MQVAIRTDASLSIGAGHVMRCAALAKVLLNSGATVTFVCRKQEGDLRTLLLAMGFDVLTLQTKDFGWQADAEATMIALSDRKPDWLVVDHYGLGAEWQAAMRQLGSAVMVIDDLASRAHDADLLLDQNLRATPNSPYDTLVPTRCMCLLGPYYALLDPAFRAVRSHVAPRSGKVKRLLCFFGGVDFGNETAKALDALALLDRIELDVDVVVGAANPHRSMLAQRCAGLPGVRFHCQTTEMAQLMGEADLFLGAGGSTVWERCCVGLPGIVVAVAENQISVAQAAAQAGALCYLGTADQVSVAMLADTLSNLLATPDLVRAMSEHAFQLVDGLGADRVVQRMRQICPSHITLRYAHVGDEAQVLEWRNAEPVRMASFNTALIAADQHRAWFRSVLADADRHLLIAERNGAPVAVLRFDITAIDRVEVSLFVMSELVGRGVGSAVLYAGEQWLGSHLPEVRNVHAAIRSDNYASLAIFSKAGYCFYKDNIYQLTLPRSALLVQLDNL